MKISIIGCGSMGSILALRLAQYNELFFYDRNGGKSKALEEKGYGKSCANMEEAIQRSKVVILAVKPQNLEEIVAGFREDHLLVSLLAGVSLSLLKKHFPNVRIVRMMPNLAMIHGEGVIGLSGAVEEDFIKAMERLGKVYCLPEEKIDALTSLTASGPAFVCVLVEAMIDAGIAMGFNKTQSRDLVYQMLSGTVALLEGSDAHPGEVKWQIASPQGTTIAGLRRLEELALRGGIINTFLAAYERAANFPLPK